MLDQFKKLLGISEDDKSQDGLLQFVLDLVSDEILNYCNITELPAGLENVAIRAAIDEWRNSGYGSSGATGAVKSVTRGDVKTDFDTAAAANSGGSLIAPYTRQLNAFRKLR